MATEADEHIVERRTHRNCHKIALALHDGLRIETAFHHPSWLCVSTQAGCPLACAFCETGARGFQRNLSASEILAQRESALQFANETSCPGDGDPDEFQTISCSGMGEPLLNLDAVAVALRHWHRHTTSTLHLSTLGILPQLPRLFSLDVPFALDLSLHATTDRVRTWLIPVNTRFPICTLLEMLFELNHRRRALLTICYMLLDGLNDSDEDLQRLLELLEGRDAVVELKKYNPVSRQCFRMSPPERFFTFLVTLRAAGISSYIFGNEGLPINAGCGQLVWSLDALAPVAKPGQFVNFPAKL
jgi:23S rRNA (adenine2503-C2)-methyltransferase